MDLHIAMDAPAMWAPGSWCWLIIPGGLILGGIVGWLGRRKG